MPVIKKLKESITGFSSEYSVKERIFIYYIFFFFILSLVAGITNLINKLDFYFNYKWISVAGFSIIVIILALRKYRVNMLHRTAMYVFVLVILPASGITSSGLAGPGIVYSFMLLIMINYLMKGWERIFLDASVIIINILISVLYRYHPEIFKSVTDQDLFFDWVVTVSVVSVFTAILLIAFEKAYETERKISREKSERLKELSRRDHLTGLYNRVHMEEKLAFMQDVFLRTGVPYSIIMIDIDYFKRYNDMYGHPEGDRCLKEFAGILKRRIHRNTDWAYRYGGEEFLILLGFSDEKAAETVAVRIQQDLKEAAIVHGGSACSEYVTVSMGIAAIHNEGSDPAGIINAADKALYRSKENGRNMITVYKYEVR